MKNGPFVNLYRIFVNLSHIQKTKRAQLLVKSFSLYFCVYFYFFDLECDSTARDEVFWGCYFYFFVIILFVFSI